MARWEIALEEQVRLMRFWRTKAGFEYAESFRVDKKLKGMDSGSFFSMLPYFESARLERAEPTYVDEDVMAVLEAAAPSIKPEPLLPEELFTETGFAVLPSKHSVIDTNGKMVAFRAFSWGPLVISDPEGKEEREALGLTFYSHVEDDDDYGTMMPGRALMRAKFNSDLSMFHSTVYDWGTLPKMLQENGELELDELFTFVLAFFRLAEQRVTVRERAYGDRAARKRMARLKENDGVLVVTLRRAGVPRAPEGENAVEWRQRWVVAGHWRNHYFPAAGEHRQIWIDAHVKGPEGKPLVLHSGRVIEFTR